MTSNSKKTHFKIIVDADSCPVKEIIFRVAKETSVPVVVVASVSHCLDVSSENVSFVSVDNIPQAADIAIINRISGADIVVTGDYGLASLVLAKSGVPISPRGFVFKPENIDNLLFKRHIEAKIRRGGGKTSGPKAFSAEDRQKFEQMLRRIIAGKQSETS
ncbi:MAG TPA: YaiI/YqxD family protein [Desulfobacteria bacterium]|nr:YaiI/YqxD family protein [Desulfobacteria bacterium]